MVTRLSSCNYWMKETAKDIRVSQSWGTLKFTHVLPKKEEHFWVSKFLNNAQLFDTFKCQVGSDFPL